VHAFVDCDGDGKRGADESGIIFNVNMIQVDVLPGTPNNMISTNNNNFNASGSNTTHLSVHSGSPTAPSTNSTYGDNEFANHAFAIKVTVKVTGGGGDQRRGIDQIGIGYIQQVTADSFMGTYADGRTLQEVIVQSSATPSTAIVSGSPAMLAFPVRDHWDHTGTDRGINVFINSSSDNGPSPPASGVEQRVVRVVDSPGIGVTMIHPVTHTALASISGTNQFDVFLTAFSKNFDKNYTVFASTTWSLTYGTFTAGGGWTSSGATVTAPGAMTVHNPPLQGQNAGIERCSPGFTQNYRMDARH